MWLLLFPLGLWIWWIMQDDANNKPQTIANDYSGIPFGDIFQAAETLNNLPKFLLVEVARQESGFNQYAQSSAGALGIMQIVPRWHPGIDPYNPHEAIPYAAQYLAQLRAQTGSWHDALAAYNWGIGNLQRFGFAKAPEETRNYVKRIGSRLPYPLA